MDILDWVAYVSGSAFGLLTLGLGLSRVTAFAERDIQPVWWLAFIVVGAIWAVSLIGDWLFPIDMTVFVANGGSVARQLRIGDQVTCLPAESYEEFTWRFGAPDSLIIEDMRNHSESRFKIGKGTWFVNASPETVTADMYDREADSIDFGGLFAQPESGPIRVNAHYGQPFRMFTQSSLDRAYDPNGNVRRLSRAGPCRD